MLKVTFLGTSSGIPTTARNMSCIALELPNKRIWLVDCGAGTQQQMIKAGLWIGRVDKFFITHLHGDHCYDIVGLLALRGMRKIKSPVEVIGTVGIKELIDATTRLSALYLPFQVKIIELESEIIHDLGWKSQDESQLPSQDTNPEENHAEGDSHPGSSSVPVNLDIDGSEVVVKQSDVDGSNLAQDWHVSAYPLDHRVACFGYIFNEKRQVGAFDGALAGKKGVKGKDVGKLANGESLTLENGTVISKQDCLKPSYEGRKLAILGDTHVCSKELHEAASQADVMVHEATFDAGMLEQAKKSKHATAQMAGECAVASNVKSLIITHFSARYTDAGSSTTTTVDDLLEEAKSATQGSLPVFAAHDFWSYEVAPRKPPVVSKESS